MGIINDLFKTVSEDEGSSEVSSDPKQTTSTVNNDGDAEVRNTTVVINHDTGGHDMLFSKTTVMVKPVKLNMKRVDMALISKSNLYFLADSYSM